MNWFRQIAAVTMLGLRTLPSRKGASLVIVIGMACAVGALVAILSMSVGFMQTALANGRNDRVLVMSRNAEYEGSSSLTPANLATISDAPGVSRDTDGKPIVSGETLGYTMLTKKSDGFQAFVTVRGIGRKAMALRPEIHLISGRMFQPGKFEVIAGRDLAGAFNGLELGDKVQMPNGLWTVTGTFASGDQHESELLADNVSLLSALRAKTYKGVWVKLESAGAFKQFNDALTGSPTLTVDAIREAEYNAKQAESLNSLLKIVAYVVGGIMGAGALFGALNTMYSSISSRTVEIATLRAIGFGGSAVLVSVLTEALLLAAIGALIGAGVAWIAFNGNSHVFGGMALHLAVTPSLILGGMIFACALGFLGGVFPAARAARGAVADALRAR